MPMNLAYQKPYPILDPEKMKGRDDKAFIVDDDLLAAANVALALGRPLLLLAILIYVMV
jgi:hypothetical protein